MLVKYGKGDGQKLKVCAVRPQYWGSIHECHM